MASINSHLRVCTRIRARRTLRLIIPATLTLAPRITLSILVLDPDLQVLRRIGMRRVSRSLYMDTEAPRH